MVSATRTVEIRVEGDSLALSRVRMTARELLRRLDVEPSVTAALEPTARAEPEPVVVAYLDLREISAPTIEILDGRTRQELTRRRLSDVTSLEAGVEALLHVLYLTVEASLQVSVAPPAPPPEPKKPAPPEVKVPAKTQRSRAGVDVGPFLRLSSLGEARIVPGGGLMLEPRANLGRVQAGLQLSGAVLGTSELVFGSGVAQVRPLQLRAIPTFDWLLSPALSGCLGVGGGVDSLLVDPVQGPGAEGVARNDSALDPVVTGLVGARVPVSGRVFLSALASLDIDLAPTTFVARSGDARQSLLALPRLRAGFTLAFSFSVAGAGRFPPLAEIEQ